MRWLIKHPFLLFLIGQLSGHGTASAVGGFGYGPAGGGAGGRIAIHTWDSNDFKGSLLAYGSSGTTGGDLGGPGTVFVEDRIDEFEYESK